MKERKKKNFTIIDSMTEKKQGWVNAERISIFSVNIDYMEKLIKKKNENDK